MTHQNSDQGRLLEEYYFRGRSKSPEEQAELVREIGKLDPKLAEQLLGMYGSPTGNPDRSISNATPTDAIDLATNTEFGNCLIVKEIGAGGMGAVYLVLDQVNRGRPSALKILKPAMLDNDGLQRFEQETAALALLEHANIARLYRPGVQRWNDADRPYFVMEYIDGRTLDRHVAEHPLSVNQRLEILEKICLAVDYGHRRNVFHRDLKPGNILVTADHEPKIIDYGISHVAEPTAEAADDGQRHERSGTIAYMAPETAGGIQGAPDARTDVYSLGIIAFELLAGHRPMLVLPSGQSVALDGKESAASNMQLIADCDREFLGDADPKSPEDLEIVIAKALCRDVSGRYSNSGELALEFQRVRERQPIRARPKSRIYDAQMFVRRNPTLVAALVTAFVLTIIAAVALGVGESTARHALAKEAAARKVATDRGDEIQRQVVAAHFRSADLAEQRGDWSVAVEEYRAIRQSDIGDNLLLDVRELRALGRLNRFTDAMRFIDRICTKYPDADRSPQFGLVRGFILWTSDPDQSTKLISQALTAKQSEVDADRLSIADRAFAQGLITPEIHTASDCFREAVTRDPFNHDAWALLALCDLAMGQSQRCEQDAGVLQRLFPASEVGNVIAAIGAAFQGRREASNSYLDGCTQLPLTIKGSIRAALDYISGVRSVDDARTPSPFVAFELLPGIIACADQINGSHSLPTPVTFRSMTGFLTAGNLLQTLRDPEKMWQIISQWPNADGELATGWLAMTHDDYSTSIPHLKKAITSPALIDCRRLAALTLVFVDHADCGIRHVPVAQTGIVLQRDFDQLITFGGLVPDRFPEEWAFFSAAEQSHLDPQVRKMAHMVLARLPDNPQAMYHLAFADANLNDKAEACALFNRAISLGLTDPWLTDARRQIATITAAAHTTRPNATPQE